MKQFELLNMTTQKGDDLKPDELNDIQNQEHRLKIIQADQDDIKCYISKFDTYVVNFMEQKIADLE